MNKINHRKVIVPDEIIYGGLKKIMFLLLNIEYDQP